MASFAVPRNNRFSRSILVGIVGAVALGGVGVAGAPPAHAAAGVVGDSVWEDLNANGAQDPGEPGVPGVTVWLLHADSEAVDETFTDEDGRYQFQGVLPGEYSVSFQNLPPEAAFTTEDAVDDDELDSDPNPLNGHTPVFSVAPNATMHSIDAGIIYPPLHGFIGSHVWIDANGDGIQGDGGPGLDGVTVRLLDEQGSIVDETVTRSGGRYIFGGLEGGEYRVEVALPVGWVYSTQFAGDDPELDSNADPQTGRTDLVSISWESPDDYSIDIGLGRG